MILKSCFWLKVIPLLAVSILLTGVLERPLHAQVLYGSVTGTVTDQSGAVVPGAQVTVTNEATGLKREATSDASGFYRVLDLPQGSYTVEITTGGFKPLKVTGIFVVIGQVHAQDLQLEVGTATQVVTVRGAADVLQTQKADVHTEITSYAVEKLPVRTYRNF